MRTWILMLVLVLASRARADDATGVTIDGFVVDGVIAEGKVVYADHVLPHALVRVVGERVIVIARADAEGHVHVTGLPAGTYRLEVEHGALANDAPVREPRHLTLDEPRRWCVLPGNTRTFAEVLGPIDNTPLSARLGAKRRPMIDTSSTALETDFVFEGH